MRHPSQDGISLVYDTLESIGISHRVGNQKEGRSPSYPSIGPCCCTFACNWGQTRVRLCMSRALDSRMARYDDNLASAVSSPAVPCVDSLSVRSRHEHDFRHCIGDNDSQSFVGQPESARGNFSAAGIVKSFVKSKPRRHHLAAISSHLLAVHCMQSQHKAFLPRPSPLPWPSRYRR